jgi:mono/diheme cytochrome c family protein
MRSIALLLIAGLLAGPAAAQTKPPTKQASPKTAPKTAPKTPAKSVPVTKQSPAPAYTGPTTLSGIYLASEAREGKDIYVGLCAGCHQAISHTGAVFESKWAGRPLSDLYTYMRTLMPKNDPGSLSDEEYGMLLAYMLQMNEMPAGSKRLSTDSSELAKIRIDTVKRVRK